MPDLQFAPEPTRISSSTIAIAAVFLAAIAAASFWFTPHKTAEVTVTSEHTFAPHTESGPLAGPAGIKVLGATSSEDDLYVVADLKIDNKLGMPLFLTSIAATLTTASGDQVDATIVTPQDVPRLEETFAALTPLLPHQPLSLDTQIAPKAAATGTVVLLFPARTEADWKSKKAASLTLNFAQHNPLVVVLP